MKILHIIDSLGLGGAQTVVKGIFEKQKDNRNIFLFSLRKRKIDAKINHKNIITFNSKKKYSFKPIKKLRKIIEKEKIEVLHCHLFKSQLFGWILKKFYFPNIKLIMHEHGQIFQDDLYYNKFMKIAQKKTNLIIAVSKATKQKLIEKANINPEKIKVLYNFVDLDKFDRKKVRKKDIEKQKKKLGIKNDEFVIGFVGRLAKVKGCGYLIKSFPHLNFKYKCIIVGDGPERKRLEKIAEKLKVRDKIVFLGHVKNPKELYPLFNVLVSPSINESFGLAVIEAQAMKVPVIISDIEGLRELINKRQRLMFKVRNVQDLSKKINKLNKDYFLSKKLKVNGLKNAKKYSLKNYLINLKALYHNG